IKPPVASPSLLLSIAMVDVIAPVFEIAVNIPVVLLTLTLRMVFLFIDNVSTANGRGFTTAFFLSSSALANYDLTSNKNLFYAGVPSSQNLMLSVSTTNYSTLNDLQGFGRP
ncbi:MAG: hypothetical protein ACK566_02775, partial [Bacteroidota bacterium]